MNKTLAIVGLVLIICFQSYLYWELRFQDDVVTYVEYSFRGERYNQTEIDFCYVDHPIKYTTDIAKTIFEIQEGTKRQNIVLISWQLLIKKKGSVGKKSKTD
jgi:hypothetical protein